MAHAGIHPGLTQFDAARVDRLHTRQIGEERAVAAADVENPRAGLDHVGDQSKIAAQVIRRRGCLCLLGCGDLDRQDGAAGSRPASPETRHAAMLGAAGEKAAQRREQLGLMQ